LIIINEDEIRIHIKPPIIYRISDGQIKEIHQLVGKMGGDGSAKEKIQQILANIVERTGRV